MRGTDARRRERNRPDSVTQGFQVSLYKVDPRVCVFACNLLTKDDCRTALLDEVMEGWPQVPLVRKPSSRACRAERLTRAGTSPYGPVVAPSGRPEGMGPDANTGEEMALGESPQVVRSDIFNTPFINNTRRDMPRLNEVAQPLRRRGVYFIIVGCHSIASSLEIDASISAT